MIVFSRLFQEAGSSIIEYQGAKVYRSLKYSLPGKYSIDIRFVSSNSIYRQAFIAHIGGVDGSIMLNGQLYSKKRTVFQQILIPEDLLKSDAHLDIEIHNSCFLLCNGSDPLGTGIVWRSLTHGSAMMIDELHDGWYRMKCNDFENDDDFDDCIFDIRIERDGKAIDIRDVDNNC